MNLEAKARPRAPEWGVELDGVFIPEQLLDELFDASPSGLFFRDGVIINDYRLWTALMSNGLITSTASGVSAKSGLVFDQFYVGAMKLIKEARK